jgi:outer membrane biosynthesis protein TonB
LQTRGSLAETNVRSLLEAAQAERATGTLTLRQNGAGATTLYFLFGHLFHAVGEGAAGDDAVVSALAWAEGDFDFDAKAKLPADETVRSSIPELIERAGSNGGPRTATATVNPPAPKPPAPQRRSQPGSAPAPPPQPEPAAWAPPPAPQMSAAPPPVNNAGRPPAPPPAQEAPQSAAEPGGQRGQMTPAGWRRFFKQRPKPRHGREPVPVPAGQTMYDSLKTSFVDFPRLITTLEREGHTGYVRLLTENANGLIYFREGTVLECVYDAGDDPNPEVGKGALLHFNEEVNRGQGVLDVVGLTPELVDGLFELTVAQPVYTELYASWVDVPALLRFLEERRLSGTVTVRAATGTGVIILKEGKLAGAYTSESREVAERADSVLALCRDPGAMIEVKASSEVRHEPLDVSDIVGGRRPAYANSAPVAAPPPPTVAPPPVPTATASARPQAPAAYAQPVPPPQPAYTPPPAPPPPPPPQPQPVQAYAPAPAPVPMSTATGVVGDWESVVADLQQITEDQLGNRARKVKDLLGAAERSRAGIQSAIDQIPTISILFVDASRLEALANDLRARLEAYPG